MKKERLSIRGIPAILWGENSDKIYIYVHGKMSRKEYAEGFAEIAEQKPQFFTVRLIIFSRSRVFGGLRIDSDAG